MPLTYHLQPEPGGRSRRETLDYAALLNAAQLEAVTAPPGPVLVIAGAGSGKTRTLTHRVSWLVEQGVHPSHILLLTFTNKAAKEMLARVAQLLPADFSRMWGGTFHHIGHRILRLHGERVGLTPSFTILDRADAKELMTAAIAAAGVSGKEHKFPSAEVLLEVHGLALNTCTDPQVVLEERFPHLLHLAPTILEVFAGYREHKRASQAVDYDDLLELSLRLLTDHPDLLKEFRQRFQHILVDEYQDTNPLQADLVDLLADEHHQVMVVGDDAQSIYSWRGADFQNIMTFPERHPGTRVIRIETNYRSVAPILALANASIAHNTQQFPKKLTASRTGGHKPVLVSLFDTRQQAQFVGQRITELLEAGIAAEEMAVLYRSHFHSMEVQMELTRRGIPFQITSGLRFFEQAHVKDVAAYLKVALNPADEVAFKRIAQALPGVGHKTAQRIWEEHISGVPWHQIRVPAKASAAWEQWIHTQQQLVEGLEQGRGPSELIQWVMDAVYGEALSVQFTNAASRLEDLNQLRVFAEDFQETAEFLAQLSLLTNLEADPGNRADDNHRIKLSTVHQAKGLEFEVVFVLMLCDGLFPNARTAEQQEGEEEERRLFYVSITRAKDQLYLIVPKVRLTAGYGETWQNPSRFLEELPAELMEHWKVSDEPAVQDFF